MKTVLTLNNKKSRIPKEFQNNDNRYPESLAEYFIQLYSKEGDRVFDPFAGLGTTLIVSEKLKRVPFGIEFDQKRCEFVRTKLAQKENLVCGDSLKLSQHTFPKFDFSITSPPYISIGKENCLSGKQGYAGFIKDIGKIYAQVKQRMKKNSYVVIEVANIKEKQVTPLAWDICREVSKIFHFEGEVIVHWKSKGTCKGGGNYGYGYDHSYCLIFKNK